MIDNLLPIFTFKHCLTAHKKGGNYFYNLYRGTGIHLHSTLGSLAFNFNTLKNDFYQISAFTHPLAKEIYWLIIKFGRNQYHIQSLTSQEEGKKLQEQSYVCFYSDQYDKQHNKLKNPRSFCLPVYIFIITNMPWMMSN